MREIVPPYVASHLHRCAFAAVGQHDDVPQRGRFRRRDVQRRFHRQALAAPPSAVARDHGFRVTVDQAVANGLRTESRKERHGDRADLGDREKRGCDLGHHRHVERDHVAAPEPERAQAGCETARFRGKLGVGALPDFAVFAFPDDGRLLPRRRIAMAVEGVQDEVGFSAHAPARPLDAAAQIEDLVVTAIEAHVEEAQHRIPEPAGIGIGAAQQRLVVVDAVSPQKSGDRGVTHLTGRSLPYEALVRHQSLALVDRLLVSCRFIGLSVSITRHVAARPTTG
jgi:hypothetical protein